MTELKKISQSQIDAMLKESDLQDSSYRASQIHQSQIKSKIVVKNNKIQQSNGYGSQSFEEDYEESRKTNNLNRANNANGINNKQQKSSVVGESYGNEEFQSYEESRKIKSNNYLNSGATKNHYKQQLNPIQEININNVKVNQKGDSFNKKQGKNTNMSKNDVKNVNSNTIPNNKNQQTQFAKKKTPANMIQQVEKIQHHPKSKQKKITFYKTANQNTHFNKTSFTNNNNTPYNYNRLQQRQKQLLFTTLTQQNKQLRLRLAQKDKQISTIKTKYNILLEQKSQILGNAKQATLSKKLQTLQTKYNALLKQKAKQRAYKTVAQMSKTMMHGMVSEVEAIQRQTQLLNIVQKLKQRLISTEKQLKTLQLKMNQGLDYQQQLQRKLKRVQQLQLRLQKMKNQAEQDRGLIQVLKQKSLQQKQKIKQLQQQRNQLVLVIKRSQMSQATHSDLLEQLKSTKEQKQLLEKSLKQISMNFTKNLTQTSNGKNKKPPKSKFQNIQDSEQFINYKE